ncbi:MAG TPA: bifunctional metallophosphatase/5'-nucleotidase [Bacteroidales bacterium]|nr:bifunctional metallophosphatase/5'-nucleotidase [Bacteroidales bacterium]
MKRFILLVIYLFIVMIAFSQSKSGKLIIMHTNDLHSNLTGFSPELEYTPCLVGDDMTRAGFSRIAAIIDEERKINPDNLLLVDAGDFLMGTFFHIFEEDFGFELTLMGKMGYDVVALGNHEFDFGSEKLTKIINTSIINSSGNIPALTLANVEFDDKSEGDDWFKDLYNIGVIRPYHIVEKAGFKIGIFGLIGDDAKQVAPNAAPLKFTDRIKTAKKIVKILINEEKVDLVICLSHCGVSVDKDGNWTGEDVELAKKVKGIDVIVSGHTHTEIFDPIWVGSTAIVQTGAQGKNIGRFELNITNGEISSAKYQLIPVDDKIYGDCQIHQNIAGRIRMIDDTILKPMGLGYYRALAETDYELFCDEQADLDSSNLGPLVADAIWYYVNNFSPVKTDITLIAAGMIRDKIRVGNKGVQTVTDVFRVVSLGEGDDKLPGYPLAQVYLTPREIKNIIEILLVAPKMKPSYYCFYSGVQVYYDETKGLLRKIQKLEIGGKEVDFSKKNKTLYSLTANSYMLEFVGEIKGMTLGLVKVQPKHADGTPVKDNKTTWIDFDLKKDGIQEGKEWMAMVKYLQSFPDLNGNKIPDFPEMYKQPLIRTIPLDINK